MRRVQRRDRNNNDVYAPASGDDDWAFYDGMQRFGILLRVEWQVILKSFIVGSK